MTILSTGNVGIGTTTPGYKLDVAGFINTDTSAGGYKMGGTTLLTASTTSGSTLVGLSAGAALTPGLATYNTALGYQSLQVATSTKGNIAIGYRALQDLNDADTAIGTFARNTAVGYVAQANTTIGYFNTALGGNAMELNTTGSYNSAVGNWALYSHPSGPEHSGPRY